MAASKSFIEKEYYNPDIERIFNMAVLNMRHESDPYYRGEFVLHQ